MGIRRRNSQVEIKQENNMLTILIIYGMQAALQFVALGIVILLVFDIIKGMRRRK